MEDCLGALHIMVASRMSIRGADGVFEDLGDLLMCVCGDIFRVTC